MVTSAQCVKKFGLPTAANEPKYMVLWTVPEDILAAYSHVRFSALGTTEFPKKIYLNKYLLVPLEKFLRLAMARQLTHHIKVWDGAYMIRRKRLNSSYSLHSWGAAFDINAAENLQGKAPKLSLELVSCATESGLEWGGYWKGASRDGMHFQLSTLPV